VVDKKKLTADITCTQITNDGYVDFHAND